MRRPFVKVCGITRAADARLAVELGADAVGFILASESPRAIDLETAAAIATDLSPGPARVGVTVDAAPGAVRTAVETIGLDAIQAHGDETPALCREYDFPVVKAIRSRPGLTADELEPWRGFPILLDGYAPGTRGGTGLAADPALARELGIRRHRIILAGGLGPDTLRAVIEAVRPLAVDLNSAVESAPGIKDPDLLRAAFAVLDALELEPFPAKERPW